MKKKQLTLLVLVEKDKLQDTLELIEIGIIVSHWSVVGFGICKV